MLPIKYADSMKIGVISDIHCHVVTDSSKRGGYFEPAMLSRPGKFRNPFASLKKFIQQEDLKFDILLSPGDYAHQADERGLVASWSELKLVMHAADSKYLVGTIGNHDVASRTDGDSFYMIRKFDEEFPVYYHSDTATFKGQLLERSYFFMCDRDLKLHMTIINSCYDHWDEWDSSNGKVNLDQLSDVKDEIDANSDLYRICLVHHNPIIHETGIADTHDVIEGSEDLMRSLGDCDLIIHGHKHDFRFSQHKIYPRNQSILSAGSFACFKTGMKAGILNSFHVIDLVENEIADCVAPGVIRTYFFEPTEGWWYDQGFDEGFGCTLEDEDIEDSIVESIDAINRVHCEWSEIVSLKPALAHITRKRRKTILERLEASSRITKANIDSRHWGVGTIIKV